MLVRVKKRVFLGLSGFVPNITIHRPAILKEYLGMAGVYDLLDMGLSFRRHQNTYGCSGKRLSALASFLSER